LELLAVIKDGGGQLVDAENDCRPGRGESGYGLEDGVGDGQVGLVRQYKGQRAAEPEYGPEQDHYQEAVAQP